jgi:quinol monooxygenase YgiN
MAKVRVIARVVAQNGKAAEVRALLQQLIAPTHAEKGCEFYELFEADTAGRFYFNELWTSEADLQAHAASRHFAEIFGKAETLLVAPPEINRLTEVK